ncbi:hypothetical protein ACJJTC_018094 [Scirpophaga incertulas]
MRLLLFLCIFIPTTYQTAASLGPIELDELSFDKVIRKFDAAIVKFDVAFPYDDMHDAFVALAKDAKDVDELLVATVGVKDYGDKENKKLAKKYGATKVNFPIVKLFIKGKEDPLKFDDSIGVTTDALRRFIRKNTGLYLNLTGCIKELDELAIKFMNASEENRKIMLKVLEEAMDHGYKNSTSGKIYKSIMVKVVEKGDDFLTLEHDRLTNILRDQVSKEQKKALGIRMNILQTFQEFDMKNEDVKDEL